MLKEIKHLRNQLNMLETEKEIEFFKAEEFSTC